MRSAGNFHPEWGYLAPAPSFMRTVRVALVATAIGAVAGAVVVVSLVERPGTNDDSAIAAHALLTRAPVISAPKVASRAGEPGAARPAPALPQPRPQPQPSVAAAAPSAPPVAAIAAAAAMPPPNVLASTDKPGKADSISPPLPLPAPTDATVASNAPVAEPVRVPAEADVAVAPDAAGEPRTPAKRSMTKRHHYEAYPYRRQENTRSRWHDNGGFGPLFRLFSFRTGSPYSSN